MNAIRAWITSKEPVMIAGLVSGLIGLASHYGFHPNGTTLAWIGATSGVVVNLLARSKVSPVVTSVVTAIDDQLGVHPDGTMAVPPPPSTPGTAAVGGAAGGAAGAAAGGALGAALGSVLGAFAGLFQRSKP